MKTYQKISEARRFLGIPEQASLSEIKALHRKLIRKWHPDLNPGNKKRCNEMTTQINAAYSIIIGYCKRYKFSFAQEEVEKYLSAEDWWHSKFGNDPAWGKEPIKS